MSAKELVQIAPPTTATRRWVVVLTGVGSLMAALDTLVVSTALTTIQRDFHASLAQLEWTVNAYNLTFAVLLLTAAAIGDRFGRRTWYAGGLGLFALASAGCALAPNPGTLIALRAVQGAGAALIMTLGLALLSAAFPPERRGAAMGLFSAVTGIAVACGPLVGGAVVQGLDWQWIFWINVPIGLAAIPIVLRKVPESFGGALAIDVPGLLLVTGSAFGLVWGLIRGNVVGWGSAECVLALTGAAVLVAGFVARERAAKSPMLPLSLFRIRAFSAGNAAIFFTFAALFSGVFFFAQLMQIVLHYGPLAAGVRLIAWTGTFLTVAPVAGALADRIGERRLMPAGLALQTAGLCWLVSQAGVDMSYASAVGPFILAGVGVSMAIPCGQSSVVSAVDTGDLGKAAGANSMMRELGGVFGIAITAAVFAGSGGYASAAAFIHGFRPAIVAAAILSLCGCAAASALPGPARHPERRPAVTTERVPGSYRLLDDARQL